MLIPAVVYLIIFNYIPMYGVVIAFQNYQVGDKFISFDGNTEWVAFDNFLRFFNSMFFARVMKNTMFLSFLTIICGFWVPIVFALLLNEVRSKYYKKTLQTLSYLPYFISSVIIVGIVVNFLSSSDGIINNMIEFLGGQRVQFLNEPRYFRAVYIIMIVWQTFGWSSILYMAAMSGIDTEQYEAATIDGGNRFQQAIYITLPGIMPTIILMLLMEIGRILTVDSERILLLYNPAIYETADVIGTYTYRTGLIDSRYSYASAIGLFSTVVNFTLLTISNKMARKAGSGLW
ncbi:MAG: sugar ABC transporter permease [Ruminiclostridium sp.]|nr:sugar ABC transporter permease [Ruminiclostridium sp.]